MAKENEAEVRKVVVDWTKAIADKDRKGILANHADELLMFDFVKIESGLKAYDKTWDFFFQDLRGPVEFTPSNIKVTAGDDVAFVSCEIHCDGTTGGSLDLRLTVGLEKRDGKWVIAHEHHSMPSTEERFVEPKR